MTSKYICLSSPARCTSNHYLSVMLTSAAIKTRDRNAIVHNQQVGSNHHMHLHVPFRALRSSTASRSLPPTLILSSSFLALEAPLCSKPGNELLTTK
jgi:gluconate kinase